MKPTNKNVLVDREKYLGSSEISTIMGINPFKDRFSLLLEKAELKESDYVDNPYVDFGTRIESEIRDFINSEYNLSLKEETSLKTHSKLGLRANHDGLDKDKKINCEIKSTSMIKKTLRGYKSYVVQVQYGSMLAEVEDNILAVYHRTKEDLDHFIKTKEINFNKEQLQIFEFKSDKKLDKEIMEAADKFMEDLEKVKKNPFITERELNEKKF